MIVINTIEHLKILQHNNRPNARYYIKNIFSEFVELRGDRLYGDDTSVIGGIAMIDSIPVTVIAQLKGRNLKEDIQYNFSMSNPEGYRKISRLVKQAEKFRRPVICFVDTIGASIGEDAEQRGQGGAIANCLVEMLNLDVPIISVLLGNGGSGGALALCICDVLLALEYATLSVINPKACANIMWKNNLKEYEAMKLLKMTSKDLLELGIVDKIILEPENGSHTNPEYMANMISLYIRSELRLLQKISTKKIVKKRKQKYKNFGRKYLIE